MKAQTVQTAAPLARAAAQVPARVRQPKPFSRSCPGGQPGALVNREIGEMIAHQEAGGGVLGSNGGPGHQVLMPTEGGAPGAQARTKTLAHNRPVEEDMYRLTPTPTPTSHVSSNQ